MDNQGAPDPIPAATGSITALPSETGDTSGIPSLPSNPSNPVPSDAAPVTQTPTANTDPSSIAPAPAIVGHPPPIVQSNLPEMVTTSSEPPTTVGAAPIHTGPQTAEDAYGASVKDEPYVPAPTTTAETESAKPVVAPVAATTTTSGPSISFAEPKKTDAPATETHGVPTSVTTGLSALATATAGTGAATDLTPSKETHPISNQETLIDTVRSATAHSTTQPVTTATTTGGLGGPDGDAHGAKAPAGGKPGEEKKLDITEHLLPLPEISSKFGVSFDTTKPSASQGLSSAEAAKRLAENGPNQLSPPKRRHPALQFLHHLLGLFNLMLIVSGIAAYILLAIDYEGNKQNTYIGAILLVVAFMNALIEFLQVQKSQSLLESFLNLIPAKCYAVRDGQTSQISALDLVLGDVVLVRSGDKVPADLLVFWANELKVDNSSLTGESDPQERVAKNRQQNPLEATNLVFNGTLAVNGEGYGIVVRTGDHTVIGQIASLTASEKRRDSPLSMEIDRFVKIIAAVAAVVAIVFFIIAMTVKKLSFSYALNFAIGTFVSFCPEGLPATVTVLLTVAAKRMATRNVLVKDLQGVETLGAITLLATDKTGTLTRNQMTVTYIWSGSQLYYTQANTGDADDAQPLDLDREPVREVVYMSCLCSRARFETTDVPVNERSVLGDATEAGLLRNAALKLPDFDGIHDTYPKVLEIPFNSDNKWAMTIHKKPHTSGSLMLYLKGAPERVLRLCSKFYGKDGEEVLGDEHRKRFEEMYAYMASKGHRVLAFAGRKLDGGQYPEGFVFTKDPVNYPTSELTFYGLVSLEDPPKHGVREAIGHCREAGIKVMMVTGDHPLTAEAIGRKINLMLQDTKPLVAQKRGVPVDQVPESDCNAIVIHGEQIDRLTDVDWDTIFSKDEIIFARTSPKHKLQIVKRAQAHGHIVGVTGDGVNDSPALKKADLGIAMNQSGSDVSKEAAAMILVDDNFASTVSGIEEGRLIFQNLKKSVQYTVTHTMPEVYANLAFIIVPLPLPLAAILILVVDLGFELFLALSYAWDPPETKTGLMKLAPRKPVTEASVARLRRKAKEEGKDLLVDPELGHSKDGSAMPTTPNPAKSSKITGFFTALGKPFTKKFWQDLMEETEEETLVDGNLLSYSYLEAGTIMTVTCFISYFVAICNYRGWGITMGDLQRNGSQWGYSAGIRLANGDVLDKDRQEQAWYAGQSAYYLSIAIQQCFNLFICKARLGYPFGRVMFANKWNFIGLFGGLAFCMCIVYIPPLNVVFQTNWRLDPKIWLISVAGGIVLFGYSLVRIGVRRLINPVKYTRDVVGLQMYPTRWSTRG
ncbi:hypothetical protein HK097_004964 [Rhizophlyctis rosea]|uniref:Cation-transporting P-type ATPase N-terminal domain-containing protein n=1 Tax=Rhizophlyctis rosea TaxID=64517 RepID=A0AAD5SH35_9FUNG|nr:hypothetical protein HK097_004964 [Rhizophlyctis rosea]